MTAHGLLEGDAVTVPLTGCVPGKLPTVTANVGCDVEGTTCTAAATETGCVACQNVPLTGTVTPLASTLNVGAELAGCTNTGNANVTACDPGKLPTDTVPLTGCVPGQKVPLTGCTTADPSTKIATPLLFGATVIG